MNCIIAAGAALALGLSPVSAVAMAEPISLSQAWSRPTPQGLTTAVVYLTVTNHGAAADRLTRAATPIARALVLHRSSERNGVMSMDPVPGLEVGPGQTVRLAPGGYHLMATGLKAGLAPGRRFPVTLSFSRAGKVSVMVQVRATAPEPSMAGMKMP